MKYFTGIEIRVAEIKQNWDIELQPIQKSKERASYQGCMSQPLLNNHDFNNIAW